MAKKRGKIMSLVFFHASFSNLHLKSWRQKKNNSIVIIAFTYIRKISLDVAFSEDIIVNTSSPDAGMNFTLRTLF